MTNKDISAAYIGSGAVEKIYLGSELVYGASVCPHIDASAYVQLCYDEGNNSGMVWKPDGGMTEINNCLYDLTGFYSMSRDYRCQEYIIDFQDAINLENVDLVLDLSGAVDDIRFSECFKYLGNLESVNISGLCDDKIVSCYNMFRECTALTSVTMNSFVPGLEGGFMASYDHMFHDCTNLITVGDINLSVWSNITDMFRGCTSLVNLTITDFKIADYDSWGLEECTNLSVDSIVGMFNALPTCQNEVFQIGETNKNKLTAAQLSIATNKGWTVI